MDDAVRRSSGYLVSGPFKPSRESTCAASAGRMLAMAARTA
jgi:hypothetical protein